MKKSILKSLSTALNAYLKLDPDSVDRLKKLDGHRVGIELLPFHFHFQCVFHEHTVTLETNEDLPTAVHISGTPLAMVSMMLQPSERHSFFADDIKMTGSIDIGTDVIALFDELHIDWEEPLSQLIGDTSTHYVSRLFSGIRDFARNANEHMTKNVSEYLQEEQEWLPTREALHDFFNDIDTLRMDAERLEAKMKKLVDYAAKSAANPPYF